MKSRDDYILAMGMLITGSANTLSTKWADTSSSVGRGGGDARSFNHPFFQAAGMFVVRPHPGKCMLTAICLQGEYLCMIVFLLMKCYYSRKGEETQPADYRPIIFLLPVNPSENEITGLMSIHCFCQACCDMTGTSLMYMGLTMTPASGAASGALLEHTLSTGVCSLSDAAGQCRHFHRGVLRGATCPCTCVCICATIGVVDGIAIVTVSCAW